MAIIKRGSIFLYILGPFQSAKGRTGIYWQAKGRYGRGCRPYTLYTAIFQYYYKETKRQMSAFESALGTR